ncbi:MAG: hypothetical protein HY928_13895 [Elusimicrobia bacterium]|nr:hypothetical protein [Elusimicrobiota bacterium]
MPRKPMSPWLSGLLRALLVPVGLAATLMPRRLELFLGPLFGRLALAAGLFKPHIAAENMRRCLPGLPEGERRRLLVENFEHYGNLFLEYAHFFSIVPGHYRAYARRNSRIEGLEVWREAAAKGKGVLFVALHLGWWEMQAAAGGLAGMPLTVVTKALQPAWLHELFTAQRLATGVRAALHPGSVPTVLRALRKGECVAFMNDQYARPPMGVRARFFGAEVDTLGAVAPLSRRTGAPVVGVTSYRGADGVTRVRLGPMLDLGADAERGTQVIADFIAAKVMEHPEQWMWMHRRFKHAVWPQQPSDAA